MATLNETVLAAATALVEDAGGQVPEGASYNEVVLLAAATIIAGGAIVNYTSIPGYDPEVEQVLQHDDSGALVWVSA